VFPQKILIVTAALSLVAAAQQPPANPQPQVKVNVINVCSPSAD